MLSLELRNLSEAPKALDRLNDQKTRAQAVAEIIPAPEPSKPVAKDSSIVDRVRKFVSPLDRMIQKFGPDWSSVLLF